MNQKKWPSGGTALRGEVWGQSVTPGVQNERKWCWVGRAFCAADENILVARGGRTHGIGLAGLISFFDG
ncbi:MAG: hypothetical protein CL537_06070 [Alcanivoracaceae bacterium]|nr:hypothetical protein [Alcanivoracaceae bacterium]